MIKNHTSENHIHFFTSVMAITLSCVYFLCRFGFTIEIKNILLILGVSLFFLLSGFYLTKLLKIGTSYTIFITVAIFVCTLMIGIFLKNFAIYFSYFFALLGYVFFLLRFRSVFTSKNFTVNFLILFLIFSLFSLWISGVIWGTGFLNPLFKENIVINSVHHDNLFFIAISQMIKTYGVPGTGIDGIIYNPYHWGSNWIIANLSNLFGASPLLLYQLGYPVIILPLFFYFFLTGILVVRKKMNINFGFSVGFWSVFLLVFIGFVPNSVLFQAGVWKWDLFTSESYLFGIMASILLFSFAIFFTSNKQRSPHFSFFQILIYLLILFFSGMIGFLKISNMLMLTPVLVYLFLRLKLYTRKSAYLLIVFSAFLFYFVFSLINNKYNNITFTIYPLHFILTRIISPWRVFFFLFNYPATIMFVWLRLWQEKIINFKNLKLVTSKNKLIDVEVILILSVAGLVPTLLLKINGGSAFYFFDLQRWISIWLFLSYLPVFGQMFFRNHLLIRVFTSFLNSTVNRIFLIFILLPFIFSFIFNVFQPVLMMKNLNLSSRIDMINLNREKSDKLTFSNKTFLNNLSLVIYQPQKALDFNPKYQLILALETIGEKNIESKNKLFILIPRSNHYYWGLTPCYSNSFIAPAVSGVAMINGLPGASCGEYAYGYEYYNKEIKKTGCEFISNNSFRSIIVLPGYKTSDIEKINCKKYI